LMALKLGLEASGDLTREAAVDGMEGLVFDIATGRASILAGDHHTAMQMYIAKTEDGTLRVADRLGVVAPESGCSI
jgi:urea transport system substrate-binding protein